MTDPTFRHRQLDVDGLSIHVVEAGPPDAPGVLFLHGWPQSAAAYERVMQRLADTYRVVAMDLPGIGGSTTPPPSGDKRTLAGIVHGVVEALGLRDATLVGHDAGGDIAYAYLRAHGDTIARAVLMNIAIPGVDPWDEVVKNPHIWHFAFHAVPELPELLVAGHQGPYFDFFFNILSARPDGVSKEARKVYAEAYARPEALHAGFEWYRTFPQDEKDNRAEHGHPVSVPVLYVRGEKEQGIRIDRYLAGLRAAGVWNVRSAVIPGSGHFTADESPNELADALRVFIGAN